jgi:hypothetical protein
LSLDCCQITNHSYISCFGYQSGEIGREVKLEHLDKPAHYVWCACAAAAGDEAVHNLKERTIQLQTNSLSQKNQPAIESKGTTGAE